jgi:hypothetical protein
MGHFNNPYPLGNYTGIGTLMDKDEVQRFIGKPYRESVPPCGADPMTSYGIVQIRPVAKAQDSGEQDVGIDPKRREILGVGIQ